VRTIDLRGCLPLAIGLAGFPQLFDIFPRLARIISSTHEITRRPPPANAISNETPFILVTRITISSLDFDHLIKAKRPRHYLPKQWDIKLKYVIICHHDRRNDIEEDVDNLLRNVGIRAGWRGPIPEIFKLDHIQHVEIAAERRNYLSAMIGMFGERRKAGLATFKSLILYTTNIDPEIHQSLATLQRVNDTDIPMNHLTRLSILSYGMYELEEAFNAVLPLDVWGSFVGLKDLELDVSISSPYYYRGERVSQVSRIWDENTRERYPIWLSPDLGSTSIQADTGNPTIITPLHLNTFTINILCSEHIDYEWPEVTMADLV
jgi:hypothetical protein